MVDPVWIEQRKIKYIVRVIRSRVRPSPVRCNFQCDTKYTLYNDTSHDLAVVYLTLRGRIERAVAGPAAVKRENFCIKPN